MMGRINLQSFNREKKHDGVGDRCSWRGGMQGEPTKTGLLEIVRIFQNKFGDMF